MEDKWKKEKLYHSFFLHLQGVGGGWGASHESGS